MFTLGPKAQATTLLGHQKGLTQEGEGTSMGAAGSPWPTKQRTFESKFNISEGKYITLCLRGLTHSNEVKAPV